ncbi:hypothetical protein RCO27_17380 [Sphingosinicella sp. LHD-64]|uniref:hypothetical protein n=1 Tax=Sphingosinicella sp. LHD-64 TaxID=3072139 RepID=UPI00280E0D76|nr:hypothetical protein [Sphingosinicella sp. LHD-64]MDQ8758001.1 hypothetical protein [Sphingosinicella sp. LHD-64]
MKTILRGAVAAVAIMSFAGTAAAQTNQTHYAGPLGYTSTNPTGLGALGAALLFAGGFGTRYTAQAGALGNTQTATPTVTTNFALTGSVTKDCSFYAGNSAAATNIDFGQIGVRTGNNENVADAFEMVGPAVANINSATAGCNFNNTVSLAKANGVSGMVNSAAGGYDSNQFQANIPYTIAANWTGTTNQSGPQAGSAQSLNVAANAGSNSIGQGAWRSSFNMLVTAAPATNALVAGTYSDTITLTLAAL